IPIKGTSNGASWRAMPSMVPSPAMTMAQSAAAPISAGDMARTPGNARFRCAAVSASKTTVCPSTCRKSTMLFTGSAMPSVFWRTTRAMVLAPRLKRSPGAGKVAAGCSARCSACVSTGIRVSVVNSVANRPRLSRRTPASHDTVYMHSIVRLPCARKGRSWCCTQCSAEKESSMRAPALPARTNPLAGGLARQDTGGTLLSGGHMVSQHSERKINTDAKVKNDGVDRLPHERDESPDAQDVRPRKIMQQAASDLERGLVDTDRRAQPGVEKVKPAAPQQARPDAHLEPKKAR